MGVHGTGIACGDAGCALFFYQQDHCIDLFNTVKRPISRHAILQHHGGTPGNSALWHGILYLSSFDLAPALVHLNYPLFALAPYDDTAPASSNAPPVILLLPRRNSNGALERKCKGGSSCQKATHSIGLGAALKDCDTMSSDVQPWNSNAPSP